MLTFKQFIREFYLTEAKAEHFAHIGLDVNNPEHKNMLDAFNSYGHKLEKKNPNQYKSIDELSTAIKPHVEAIEKKKREAEEDKQAFANKDAELIHHDKETGLKVFKVRSGKGCAATGGDTKWCVAQRNDGDGHFKTYDPERENSYVIHTPEKGNLSRIGMIGVKPHEDHETGASNNFQDKGNNPVSDSDWEMLRKKYNLDGVRHLHGIRGLVNPEIAKKDEERKNKFLDKIEKKTLDIRDIDHAIDHNYLSPEHISHPKFLVNSSVLRRIVFYSPRNSPLHKAIISHKNISDDVLSDIGRNSNDEEIHNIILNHEKANTETKKLSSNTLDYIKKYGPH